ncbi:MAG: aminotransferase [Tranquillimonas sp.]
MPPSIARRMAAAAPPPIVAAQGWLRDAPPPAHLPLIDVSQAAPVDPPPEPLRRAIAQAALDDPQMHLYGPVLGRADLREAVAARWSGAYRGALRAEHVAITAGCNQAFCAAIATLADEGDEVILVSPWYFNHKMWLDMTGIRAVPLPAGDDLLPDPDRAAGLVGPRTRAIVLVSPNNPGGVEYPPALLAAFRDLARARGIALILDETYRDFHSVAGPPHDLFADPDWQDVLIHLYSFSKAYRLTGHRVGAVVAGPARIAEIEKFLDTVTICPNQLGQFAALWGMRHLDDWLARERDEILARRQAVEAALPRLDGWRLRGCGAYFAFVAHPFEMKSETLARRLVHEAGLLLLPGSMFAAAGDTAGAAGLRIAFANVDTAGIGALADRLAAFRP